MMTDTKVKQEYIPDIKNECGPKLGSTIKIEVKKEVKVEAKPLSALVTYALSSDSMSEDELYSSSDTESEDGISSGLVLRRPTRNTGVLKMQEQCAEEDSESGDSDDGGPKRRILKSKREKERPGVVSDPEDLASLAAKLNLGTPTDSPDTSLTPVGLITSMFEDMLVVQGKPDVSPLHEETVLLLKNNEPVGVVSETFGSVKNPMYCIRLKSEDVKKLATTIVPGVTVVYTLPERQDLTKFVFVQKLIKEKGTDASWKNDLECPDNQKDFSDDEQERAYKAQRREERREIGRKRTLLEAMQAAQSTLANEKEHNNSSESGSDSSSEAESSDDADKKSKAHVPFPSGKRSHTGGTPIGSMLEENPFARSFLPPWAQNGKEPQQPKYYGKDSSGPVAIDKRGRKGPARHGRNNAADNYYNRPGFRSFPTTSHRYQTDRHQQTPADTSVQEDAASRSASAETPSDSEKSTDRPFTTLNMVPRVLTRPKESVATDSAAPSLEQKKEFLDSVLDAE